MNCALLEQSNFICTYLPQVGEVDKCGRGRWVDVGVRGGNRGYERRGFVPRDRGGGKRTPRASARSSYDSRPQTPHVKPQLQVTTQSHL